MIWSQDEDTGVYDMPLRAPALPAPGIIHDPLPELDTVPVTTAEFDAVPAYIPPERTRELVSRCSRIEMWVV